MTLCYAVKLSEVYSISEKAVIAKDYSGGKCVLPKSQIRYKSGNEYWVSKFILEQKDLCYSYKSLMWVDLKTGYCKPKISVTETVPEEIKFKGNRDVDELKR